MTIGVVIPVYKNRTLVIENLKKNIAQLAKITIIVINDCPQEAIEDDVKKISAHIICLNNVENLGFAGSINKGVSRLDCDLLLLLNSDVILEKISFTHIEEAFKKDSKLFAVSMIQKDGENVVGKNRIFFSKGMVFHSKADNHQKGLNAWAEGGACIIRKSFFDKLGGFDETYYPFYWEDIDLSYRAYKKGWHTVFDPFLGVNHKHESTIGKYFSHFYIQSIAYKNQFIFIWKNIADSDLLVEHFLYLPYYIARHLITLDLAFFKGLVSAIFKLATIINYRRKYAVKYSDKKIFSLFNQ